MFEYVIVLFSKGTVTTVIGFADASGAEQALSDTCVQHSPDWAYLIKGDGQILGSVGV